jgi:hypothetical protein
MASWNRPVSVPASCPLRSPDSLAAVPRANGLHSKAMTSKKSGAMTMHASTTPFPNYLLNDVMPGLKDTEWRLLCLVVRQTLGWKDPATGSRKTRDWMTRGQLMKKTGRNSEALSKALDSLVKQRMVEVTDKAGNCLRTPHERRRVRGRVYYALHPLVIQRIAAAKQMENGAKAGSVSTLEDQETEHGATRKTNGTKETHTNKNETNRLVCESDKGECLHEHSLLEKPELSPPVHILIEQYFRRYAENFPDVTPPGMTTPALVHLHNLQQRYTEAEIVSLLDLFFSCGLAHIERQQHSLESFVHSVHILKKIHPRKIHPSTMT